jgi:hypothetical protein
MQCANIVGVAVATGGDIKEGLWSISWDFLVKWCATLPNEGVDEDLLSGIWYIYVEEVFFWYSPPMRVS